MSTKYGVNCIKLTFRISGEVKGFNEKLQAKQLNINKEAFNQLNLQEIYQLI